MSFERVVRIARLPEMRLAYLEAEVTSAEPAAQPPEAAELWEAFNAWRLRDRPALGRIDIAALGWTVFEGDGALYRAAVPIRSDYTPASPARATIFPGGRFAYCYADDGDEIPEALQAVRASLAELGYEPASGPIEVYKYHYNLDQHPADCGYLLAPTGDAPRSAGPLPIGR